MRSGTVVGQFKIDLKTVYDTPGIKNDKKFFTFFSIIVIKCVGMEWNELRYLSITFFILCLFDVFLFYGHEHIFIIMMIDR